MTTLSLPDAQRRLPDLLEAARQGDIVEITDDGWTYRLSLAPRKPRPRPPVTGTPRAGSCSGLFVVPDDFKEPLEELREYME